MNKILILILLFTSSCISTKQIKNDKSTTDQLQLQEDIQRFYTRFTERIIDASYKGHSLILGHKEEALKQYMLYDSEALKIVTAPFPVANLLDMLVFVKLNKIIINEYWIPYVFGKSGLGLLKAFSDSEKDLEHVASQLLTPVQMVELNQFIRRWRNENSEHIRVEKVRFAEFTKYAKSKEIKGKSFSLVDTASAVQAVDQMVLVANRGIFLAQQLPMIVRLHARVGTQEIVKDTVSTLQSVPAIVHELNETSRLVANMNELMIRFKSILEILPKNVFKEKINIDGVLVQINSILDKSSALIEQLNSVRPLDKKRVQGLKKEVHSFVWFLAFVALLIAACISLFWWTGFYLSKKLSLKH